MEFAALFLINVVMLRLMTYMVKEMGKRLKTETAPTQRLFLKLCIWLLAGFGLVIVVATFILVYRAIVG